MTIEQKLQMIKQLVKEIDEEIKNTKDIKSFYSSYINIKKNYKFSIKNVSVILDKEVFILPDLTSSARDMFQLRIETSLRSKGVSFSEVKVFFRKVSVTTRYFEMEAFIIVTNPKFKISTFPSMKIAVVPTTKGRHPAMYRPYKWTDGLYAGNTIKFEELIPLINRMESIRGYHFNETTYTSKQIAELATTLSKYDIINPIPINTKK